MNEKECAKNLKFRKIFIKLQVFEISGNDYLRRTGAPEN